RTSPRARRSRCGRSRAMSPNLRAQPNRASVRWSGKPLALGRPAASSRIETMRLAGIHDAEAVAFGVRKDDVVGIRWSLVPVHFGGAQRLQALHLAALVICV